MGGSAGLLIGEHENYLPGYQGVLEAARFGGLGGFSGAFFFLVQSWEVSKLPGCACAWYPATVVYWKGSLLLLRASMVLLEFTTAAVNMVMGSESVPGYHNRYQGINGIWYYNDVYNPR